MNGEAIEKWIKRAGVGNNAEAGANAEQIEIIESKPERRAKSESEPKQVSMTDFASESGLTPEEYIVRLLEGHSGKRRQQELIAETGWSRSTVSRLLGRMEARGEIVRVRLGNKNVVYLPDSVPTFARRIDPVPIPER
ncbi:helix-turn-helix transcriptional regulator [Haladaptatus cibarius]|uniref:helix-turn-helix transcriptional regulator n=1 Tax=Haladaptatus cibarius TaxID=453847 RepID=UPI000A84FEB6|nr:MarR family transcriptional regulator [Haladaptatus cibarius]